MLYQSSCGHSIQLYCIGQLLRETMYFEVILKQLCRLAGMFRIRKLSSLVRVTNRYVCTYVWM